MFIKAITSSGLADISSTSATTFLETDEIILTNKVYDGKELSLKVDIKGSTASGQLTLYPLLSNLSGGTFQTIVTGSGVSTLIVGGTSVSGPSANGSYYIPLTIVTAVGVTERLKTVPYIKFGHRGFQNAIDWTGSLCVG